MTDASGTERFLYDGNALIMEFNAGGGILARHVHGLSAGDDPIASYTGSLFAASNEQLIRQDRLGSVMLMSTDRTTGIVNVNTYDEYGVPGSGNSGRFQYTGQVWLPQIGLYHYKARAYSPTLGRFLQTDPIRYGDGLNIYAYVGNDPVNGIDPWGLNDQDPPDDGVTITDCAPGKVEVDTNSDGSPVCVDIGQIGFSLSDYMSYSFYDLGDYSVPEEHRVTIRGVYGPLEEPEPESDGWLDRCGLGYQAADWGLWAAGIAGDGLSVAGLATGNPVMFGAGRLLNFGASAGSIALHGGGGDVGALGGDLAGLGASAIPGGGSAMRSFGGAAWDAGRNSLGRFVANHPGRRAAQDTAIQVGQGEAASAFTSSIFSDGGC